jgi:hypothetical protein
MEREREEGPRRGGDGVTGVVVAVVVRKGR